jgi:hypothetical protein
VTRTLVVIPGAQDTKAKQQGTAAFLEALALPAVCLASSEAPYDPRRIRRFLQDLPSRDLIVIAFSAGVVGVSAALRPAWLKTMGMHIEALFALDGWLVPLFLPFTCYRLSHDYFTHQTSWPFGMGALNFWAEPAVSHLDFWANPGAAEGWAVSTTQYTPTNALTFIHERLICHGLSFNQQHDGEPRGY